MTRKNNFISKLFKNKLFLVFIGIIIVVVKRKLDNDQKGKLPQ
jgi:hypothetical protein